MFNFNLDAMSSKWTQNGAAKKLLDEKFVLDRLLLILSRKNYGKKIQNFRNLNWLLFVLTFTRLK